MQSVLTQCYEFHFLKLAHANQMQLKPHDHALLRMCPNRDYHSHQVHITVYCSLNCTGCSMQRINWRTIHVCIHLYFFPNFFSPLIPDLLVSLPVYRIQYNRKGFFNYLPDITIDLLRARKRWGNLRTEVVHCNI